MTAREFQQLFKSELSAMYQPAEATELFFICAESVLKLSRTALRAENIKITENQEIQFNQFLSELKKGKPFQHILGYTEFFGEKFLVSDHVLIPRPETEELLEIAIKTLTQKKNASLKILDIGTGSGCIAIILKKHFPNAEVFAIDISGEALSVAKENAERLNAEIHFRQTDYLSENIAETFDLIISNPPYIGNDEKNELTSSVKDFEPASALFPRSDDVLQFYRKIAADCEIHLNSGGYFFLEINQKYGEETLALFKKFPEKSLLKDLSGNDRFVVGRNL